MLNWKQRGHVLAMCDQEQEIVYCRVVGLGNMNNCSPFQSFSLRMQARGYQRFVLDFSTCDGLDSTFLGILLGIAIGDRTRSTNVVVVNPPKNVLRTLTEVGIDHLVRIEEGQVSLPEVPMHRLSAEEQDPEEKISMMLKAHEDLCKVDEENRRKFGSFLRILRDELSARRNGNPQNRETSEPL